MVDTIGNKSLEEGRPWSRLPVINEDLRKLMVGSADFLAVNYYTSRLIAPSMAKSFQPSFESDAGLDYSVNKSWTRATSEWLYSVPEGLFDLLQHIKQKYSNPTVMITENGFSDGGEIEDEGRLEYLKSHLASVARAIEGGCNVVGYTVWSIIDNFEWLRGYTEKFGIFAVDSKSKKKERLKKVQRASFKS
jgi:beta-glucosidase/6-phospho-beta-glucosidase/beta-galactosidase